MCSNIFSSLLWALALIFNITIISYVTFCQHILSELHITHQQPRQLQRSLPRELFLKVHQFCLILSAPSNSILPSPLQILKQCAVTYCLVEFRGMVFDTDQLSHPWCYGEIIDVLWRQKLHSIKFHVELYFYTSNQPDKTMDPWLHCPDIRTSCWIRTPLLLSRCILY